MKVFATSARGVELGTTAVARFRPSKAIRCVFRELNCCVPDCKSAKFQAYAARRHCRHGGIAESKSGAGGASPRVDVLVSQGSREEAYVMPHLIGMNLADAVRRLDSVSIKRKLNSVSAPQWPHGAVIDQTPTRVRVLPRLSSSN